MRTIYSGDCDDLSHAARPKLVSTLMPLQPHHRPRVFRDVVITEGKRATGNQEGNTPTGASCVPSSFSVHFFSPHLLSHKP
jgi:hypothetical protein